MRKFTLILASLFLSLGTVWAQTPVVTVTEIGTAPYKLSDEDAEKIFGLEDLTVVLDVTTAASLSGRGAFFCVADPGQAVPESFSGTNTSYMACGHNGAGAAYLAAATSGQHFSTGTIPANSTIRLAYVFDKTNTQFKIYIGDTNTGWTMNRNFGDYEIATPKMVKEDFENANIYIGGGMVNNNAYELGDATIHAVRVFNGTLTIDEIKALEELKKTVDITYDFTYNGKLIEGYSQTVKVLVGEEYPEIAAGLLPFGISATKPEGVVAEDAATTITLELKENLPFTYADSYEKITDWYYVKLKGQHFLYHVDNQDYIALDQTAVDENNKDAYSWAFVGDPFNGYQIVNRSTGKGYVLSSSTTMAGNTGAGTHPIMTALPVAEGNNELWMFTASSHQTNGFFAGQKGYANNRMNNRDNKLAYWNSGADNGSTFTVVARGEVTLAGAGTEASPYLINNVDDLILFRNSVNAGETKYSAPGVYVALGADIDLTGENWVGIGSVYKDHGFMGNFDGKTFKIKNLTITDPAADSDGYVYAGLFSVTEGTDKNNQNVIKNLTIENVTISTTGHIVSAAIAYPYYTIVDKVNVCGNISITGGDYTAGALAYTRRCVNASNITVAGNDGSTITGATTVGGVISDIQMNGGLKATYSDFSVSGVSITGTEMVGGISGIICEQTLAGASVSNVSLASGDSRVGVISGAFGGTSTISNVVVENVTGATAIVGPTYKGANPVEAKIGDTYYGTLAEAVKATGNVELLTEVTLKDDVAYESKSSKQVNGTITYTRNLTAFWNPIYLPFAVTLSTEDYDVAEFTSAEGETLTLTKIKDATATLNANTAYVIRPKTDDAKTLTITLENATLEAATVKTQELGEGFSVKGNYSELTGAKLGANDRVVGTNGNWGVLKSESKLKPYRLILTIPSTAKAISMRVEGEDVTSIENLGITIEGDVIFDLMGRRVETMTEGGIYIVNGKKIVF